MEENEIMSSVVFKVPIGSEFNMRTIIFEIDHNSIEDFPDFNPIINLYCTVNVRAEEKIVLTLDELKSIIHQLTFQSELLLSQQKPKK